MKKILNIVKHNTLFGIIIGIVICSISLVLAESINSDEVLYDNSNSSSNSDNVQEALDDVYSTLDKVGSGYSLVSHNTTGLSTELIGGLYRYQGVQDVNNTVDNYICFGTTNKSDCIGDTDKYMYRIIGINTNGQMKLIKKEALNTAYAWSSNTGVTWPNSDLYKAINGSIFLNNLNYVPSGWSDRIAVIDWHYYTSSDNNASTIAERELGAPTVNAKIGLMYLHDYGYALATPGYSNTSWIHLSKNDTSPPDTTNEWTITRNPYGYAITMFSNGNVGGRTINNTSSVRPVFFLTSNQAISSGNGTLTDPYILS